MKTKERKEIRKACHEIELLFEDQSRDNPVTQFIYEVSEDDRLIKKIEDRIGSDDHRGPGEPATVDIVNDLTFDILQVSFSMGYCLGQAFDVAPSKSFDLIRQAIREKGLLPYLPRERRGHEEEGHQQAEEGG